MNQKGFSTKIPERVGIDLDNEIGFTELCVVCNSKDRVTFCSSWKCNSLQFNSTISDM